MSRDQQTFPAFLRGTASLLAIFLAFTGACAALRPAKAPLETVGYSFSDTRAETLIVMLPGRGDVIGAFEQNGFPAIARQAGWEVDMIAVDAHFGYYRTRTVVDRIHDDVVAPALRQGYERIWLVGVSLGATGSLLYALERPEDLAGVVALAPFLGKPGQIAPIREAGGVGPWQAPAPKGRHDFPLDLWRWFKLYTGPESGPVPLYVGYGTEDRFAEVDSLLADLLPDDHVFTMPGGHRWTIWTQLWERIVNSVPRAG